MKRLVSGIMLVVLLAACGGKEAPEDKPEVKEGDFAPLEEKTTVTIAEDGAASGAGFYIAMEKGYFDDYNIDAEFTTFANSDDMLPALASGEVDIAGGVSTASFFNAIAQGIDVKIIADKGHYIEGDSYFSFVLRKELEDEVTDYEDLKGKRIAVSARNTVDDYIYQKMLDHAGLTEEDVEFVLMSDFGNMLAAMGNGSIDAALQIEPLITQGINEGLHVRFHDATDFAPDAQIAMVLGSPDFVKNSDVSVRFMAAYLKGLRDYHEAFVNGNGMDEIISIMTKHTALKDEEVWKDVGVTGLDPNGEMFIEDIKKQYDMYKENGAIQGDIDFDNAIVTDMTDEAIEVIGKYEK
ncbi:ABC transporter substrate-binding protein [Salimicrobium halophilum]|uniref:NitT/TauT family transport system substrate-binding protein n=1 Tax=Salimicrobium halophilum TaxID=86666 RepID=A0A1G8RK11_9BACI|nr:ABC transporter substrate-binding protein [Salimicrobium halophilum]SDJ16710.1 NitT/TauT family transport system substrate-binding protein [Salimicrobium halophilum]